MMESQAAAPHRTVVDSSLLQLWSPAVALQGSGEGLSSFPT